MLKIVILFVIVNRNFTIVNNKPFDGKRIEFKTNCNNAMLRGNDNQNHPFGFISQLQNNTNNNWDGLKAD